MSWLSYTVQIVFLFRGELVFLGNSPLSMLCSPVDGSLPVTERLERPYFGLHRLDWRNAIDDPGGIEFNLPISGWFRLFRDTGFEVLDFLELQAPAEGASANPYCRVDWAQRFPLEQVWKLRKRAG